MASNQQSLIGFDYAIKYLLIDKGEYGVVESFISALLKTQGYKDVKIVAMLNSGACDKYGMNKCRLADLIVEDEDHHYYIIEIERNIANVFFQKSCFNTNRLIVNQLAQGVDYKQIIKIIHISLLYYPLGKIATFLDKTLTHEIETKKCLSVKFTNEKTGQKFDATDIPVEYFYISVPSFSGPVNAEIDEWLYILKNDQVHNNSHSPCMKLVKKKLKFSKMTFEDKTNYYRYKKDFFSFRDELEAAANKGMEDTRNKIAKNLIKLGTSYAIILECTGLSKDELKKLKNNN